MIRYKLLKDLPFVKAGTMVEMWSDGTMSFADEPNLPRFNKKDVQMFPLWFEEVKEPGQYFTINILKAEVDEVMKIYHEHWAIGNMKSLGLLFETREEAEKYLVYLKAKAVIKEDANGFKADWTDEKQDKFHGQWDYFVDKLYAQVDWKLRDDVIYFESLKALKESFKKHPDEWKIYLAYEQ